MTRSLRRLLAAHEFAAAGAAQLRFAIPPGSPARRVADSLDPDRRVPVYDSLGEAEAAIAWHRPSRH